jgi:hypothetical protein
VYYYVTKPKPSGPDSMPWAIGIFTLIFLGGVVVVSYVFLLLKLHTISLIILATPLLFFLLAPVKNLVVEVYVRFPGPKLKPINLEIINNRPNRVHVKIECMLATFPKGAFFVYRTLDFYVDANGTKNFKLTKPNTLLLAYRQNYASIMLFDQELKDYHGKPYVHEIQPCFKYFKEEPAAFTQGQYELTID